MKESILHYVWQYKLFPQHQLKTTDGESVEVIDVGRFNTDAGPDFFNAKIRIGETVWAGNVEFHQRSSDWKRHNHVENQAYDNVILHIAEKVDDNIFRTNGEKIPQMELKVPEDIRKRYDNLLANKTWIACENKIREIDSFKINAWKNTLLTERLENKTDAIYQLLEQSENHWEEAFYISLARSFGFGINSQPFEMLAKTLPLNILAKHKDNLLQLEALLFGQAGFLENELNDDYQQSLKKEYRFLQSKYVLKPIDASQWKLLRLRPENFPHIRLAQFAKLIHRSSKLFSKILETENVNELRKMFQSEVSDYWQKHYLFGKESRFSRKKMGNGSIDILLINTVVPFLFSYGRKKNSDEQIDKALNLLENLPAENNSIIEKWKGLNIFAENAFDSQALLQLKKNYCDEKKCLRCRIGHQILTLK
ncbi:conserved hypothetical protein [uncultured Paludibacter sp.]|nr:conserved hypothetical protein [uncultured Paludibacter sp.]